MKDNETNNNGQWGNYQRKKQYMYLHVILVEH